MAVDLYPVNTHTNHDSLQSYLPIKEYIIPIWLRDTFGQVQQSPIYNLHGEYVESIDTEDVAKALLIREISNRNVVQSDISSFDVYQGSDSRLFLAGSDIFGDLVKNYANVSSCTQTVNIIIHSLRDLYWNNRHMLPAEEVKILEILMKFPLPKFKNIFDYDSLKSFRDTIGTPMYQLFGDITPFSVISIPVRHFIESINNNIPIQVQLSGTNIVIQLDYQPYDFWDFDSQSLVNYIDIGSTCK
jgi:hypothetical protein